jgi:hypothetical protein
MLAYNLLRCALAALFAVCAFAHAQNSEAAPDTSEVARYLSIVEVATLNAGSRLAQSRGDLNAIQSKCVQHTDWLFFMPFAESFISNSLSLQEQKIAGEFFRKEGGENLLAKAKGLLLANAENIFVVMGEFLEAHQHTQVQKFVETSAGEKLFKNDLFHKGASGASVLEASQSRVQQCRNAS